MPVFVSILKHYGSPQVQVLPSAGSRGSGINLCCLPWLTLPSAGPYDPNKLEKTPTISGCTSIFLSAYFIK